MARRQTNRNRGSIDVYLPRKSLIRHTEPALSAGEQLQTSGSVETAQGFSPLFDHSSIAGLIRVEGGGATLEVEHSIDGQEVDKTDTITVTAGTPEEIQIPTYGCFVRVTLTADADQTTTRALIYATTRIKRVNT